MPSIIRLQLLVDGKQQALSDAKSIGEGVAEAISKPIQVGIGSALSQIGSVLGDAFGKAFMSAFTKVEGGLDIKQRLEGLRNTSGLQIDPRIIPQPIAAPFDPERSLKGATSNILPQVDSGYNPKDLGQFAEQVKRAVAANQDQSAWFGDNKQFIADAHTQYSKMTGDTRSLQEFKNQLTDANREGGLKLSRADLVAHMDPEKVASSETKYLNAEFHFVQMDPEEIAKYAKMPKASAPVNEDVVLPELIGSDSVHQVSSNVLDNGLTEALNELRVSINGLTEKMGGVTLNEDRGRVIPREIEEMGLRVSGNTQYAGATDAGAAANLTEQGIPKENLRALNPVGESGGGPPSVPPGVATGGNPPEDNRLIEALNQLRVAVNGLTGKIGDVKSNNQTPIGEGKGDAQGNRAAQAKQRDDDNSRGLLNSLIKRNIETTGDATYAGAKGKYDLYDLQLKGPEGESYTARARAPIGSQLEGEMDLRASIAKLTGVKPVSAGLQAAATYERINSDVLKQIKDLNLKPVEDSKTGPSITATGIQSTERYLDQSGQQYLLKSRELSGKDQFTGMNPVKPGADKFSNREVDEMGQLRDLEARRDFDKIDARAGKFDNSNAQQTLDEAMGGIKPHPDALSSFQKSVEAAQTQYQIQAASVAQQGVAGIGPMADVQKSYKDQVESAAQSAKQQHDEIIRKEEANSPSANKQEMDWLSSQISSNYDKELNNRKPVLAAQQSQYDSIEANQLRMSRSQMDSTTSRGGIFSPGYKQTEDPNVQQKAAGLFTNARTAKLNLDTKQFDEAIHKGTSEWNQFIHRIVGDGGTISKSINVAFIPLKIVGGVLTSIESGFNSIGNTMIRVSAIFYSFERIGNLVKGAFLGPFERIDEAAEKALKFREAISGTVGGMSNAKAIDNGVVGLSRNLPLTLDQTREMARGITDISAIAPQMSLSTPEYSGQLISKLTDIAARIAVNNPDASQDSIVKSLQNAMLGNLRGLRLTARIDPNDLTAVSGMSQKGLQGNQDALVSAISQVVQSRVPDSVLADRQALPSVQWAKLTEQIDVAFQKIGADSGLMGMISEKFHSMMLNLAGYVDSSDFSVRAQAIGDDLGRIFDNVVSGGGKLLDGFGIMGEGSSDIDKFTDQVQKLIHMSADGSELFGGLPKIVGEGLSYVSSAIINFIQGIVAATEQAAEARYYTTHKVEFLVGDDNPQRPKATLDYLNQITGNKGVFADVPLSPDAFPVGYSGENGPYAGLSGKTSAASSGSRTDVDGSNVDHMQDFLRAATTIMASHPIGEDGQFIAKSGIAASILSVANKFGVKLDGLSTVMPGVMTDGGFKTTTYNKEESQIRATTASQNADFRKTGIEESLSTGSAAGLYNQKFSGLYRNIDTLGGAGADKFDKLAKVLDDGASQLQGIFRQFKTSENDTPGNFFEKVGQWEKTEIDKTRNTIGSLNEEYEAAFKGGNGDEIRADEIRKQIGEAEEYISRLATGLRDAMKRADDELQEASGRFTIQGIEAAKGEDPILRDIMTQRFLKGQTDTQSQISDHLRNDGETGTNEKLSGYGTLGIDKRMKAFEDGVQNRVAALKEKGVQGNSPDVSSLLSGEGVQNKIMSYYMTQIPIAQENIADTKSEYDESQTQFDNSKKGGFNEQFRDAYSTEFGDDSEKYNTFATSSQDVAKKYLAYQRANGELAKMNGQMQELENKTNVAREGFVQFGNSTQTAISGGLANALDAVIERTGKVSDAFKAMGKQIVSAFSHSVTGSLTDGIFGKPGANSGLGGGLLGNLFSSFGGAGSSGGGPSGATSQNGQVTGGTGNESASALSSITGFLGKGLLPSAMNWIGGLIKPAAPAASPFGPGDPSISYGGTAPTVPIAPITPLMPPMMNLADFAGVQGMANGGIFKGDFTPFVTHFSAGGVSKRPTMGLISEVPGHAEGIVPLTSAGHIPLGYSQTGGYHVKLPFGRSIPASIGHSDGGGVRHFASGGVTQGHVGHESSSSSSNDHYNPSANKLMTSNAASQQLTIVNLADREMLAQFTMAAHGKTLVNEVLSTLKPGGVGRRILSKT